MNGLQLFIRVYNICPSMRYKFSYCEFDRYLSLRGRCYYDDRGDIFQNSNPGFDPPIITSRLGNSLMWLCLGDFMLWWKEEHFHLYGNRTYPWYPLNHDGVLLLHRKIYICHDGAKNIIMSGWDW